MISDIKSEWTQLIVDFAAETKLETQVSRFFLIFHSGINDSPLGPV